jgi:hypothetical protein
MSERLDRPGPGGLKRSNATIEWVDGGYSSAAERLTVAQDVVGSIPTSRPKIPTVSLSNLVRYLID